MNRQEAPRKREQERRSEVARLYSNKASKKSEAKKGKASKKKQGSMMQGKQERRSEASKKTYLSLLASYCCLPDVDMLLSKLLVTDATFF